MEIRFDSELLICLKEKHPDQPVGCSICQMVVEKVYGKKPKALRPSVGEAISAPVLSAT